MSKLPDYRITSLKSFEETTEEPRQVAALYFFYQLDCLIDSAYKVSFDFRRRPELYRDLEHNSLAATLAQLNAQYGSQATLLSAAQRNEIFLPIFGKSPNDSFPHLRDDFIQAATIFAESSASGAIEILRDSVRVSHTPFKNYLLGLHGDSLRFSKHALSEENEKTCYPVLRSPAIAAAFGVSKKASVEYPYAHDPAVDLLIEAISSELTWTVHNTQTRVTREGISNLQRAALSGAEAIATVIDFDEAGATTDADLNLLIRKSYIWGAALASIRTQPKNWLPTTVSQKVSRPTMQATAPTAGAMRAGPK